MNTIEKNIIELNKLQSLQQRSHWMNKLHPLGKLLISIIYIIDVVSFDKYDIVTLLVMSVYLIFGFVVGELSLKEGIYRMRLILPLLIFTGIFNPFFDRQIIFSLPLAGGKLTLPITSGIISMLTLMIKGLFTILATYILIALTSIEDICYALRMLHIPKTIVIVIMLIYRYLGVMAEEADRMTTAYKLRAPSQKGLNIKVWGTFVGQWLLRSMDKAGIVYESMLLRGFKGDFITSKRNIKGTDIAFFAIWLMIITAIRFGGFFR
ncbi:MAG: cobalt ECF transporter T component CbiQ [Butyrivibrio sp.]|nr:cobalt ECF transporter T component CbiQ [Butyrivibrio sp.]